MAALPVHPNYVACETRIASFEAKRATAKKHRWPHGADFAITPTMLAQAGYFHDPSDEESDRTTCWMCHQSMKGWEEDDDPWALHLQWSPDCPAAQLGSLERARDIKQPTWSESPSHDWGADNEWHPRGPRLIAARLASFGGAEGRWMHEGEKGLPTREQLANAGFHFAPYLKKKGKLDVDDTTVCCYCDRNVSGWEAGDDPVAIHLKYGPCVFFGAADLPGPPRGKGKKGAIVTSGKRAGGKGKKAATVDEIEVDEEEALAEIGEEVIEVVEEEAEEAPAKSRKGRGKAFSASQSATQTKKVAPAKVRGRKNAVEPEPEEAVIEEEKEGDFDPPSPEASPSPKRPKSPARIPKQGSVPMVVIPAAPKSPRPARTRQGSVAMPDLQPAAPLSPPPKKTRAKATPAPVVEEEEAPVPAEEKAPAKTAPPRAARTRAGSVLAARSEEPAPVKGRGRAGTASRATPAAEVIDVSDVRPVRGGSKARPIEAEQQAEEMPAEAAPVLMAPAPKKRGRPPKAKTPIEPAPVDVEMVDEQAQETEVEVAERLLGVRIQASRSVPKDEEMEEIAPTLVAPKKSVRREAQPVEVPPEEEVVPLKPSKAGRSRSKTADKGNTGQTVVPRVNGVSRTKPDDRMDVDPLDDPFVARPVAKKRTPPAKPVAPCLSPAPGGDPASVDGITEDAVMDAYLGRDFPPAPVPPGWLANPFNPQRPLPPLTEEEKRMKLPEYYRYLAAKEEEAFKEWVEKALMHPWLKRVEEGRKMFEAIRREWLSQNGV